MKGLTVFKGASVATSATATAVIDTLGYNYLTVDVDLSTASSDVSVLKFEEGDTTSSYAAITGLTGGTSTGNFTIPTANTSTAPLIRFNVDTRGRKRYLKFSCTPGVASIINAHGIMSRARQTPTQAATVVTA